MILLDTCVVSEFAKPTPDPAVLAWMESVSDDSLRLSVLTLGEIKKGVDLLDPGPRKARVDEWLGELRATFGDRILPVDGDSRHPDPGATGLASLAGSWCEDAWCR